VIIYDPGHLPFPPQRGNRCWQGTSCVGHCGVPTARRLRFVSQWELDPWRVPWVTRILLSSRPTAPRPCSSAQRRCAIIQRR
jgi:hypothetical protein